MTIYAITIQPVTRDGQPAESARAVICVDTSGESPRIVEMTLQSSAPNGLTSASLPRIDLGRIAQALQAGIAGATPTNAEGCNNGEAENVSQRDSITLRENALSESNGQRTDATESGRVYRRMPDVSELRAVYDRIGSVTGVAKHYGVPRHTAQGWMGRLRKLAEKAELKESTNPNSADRETDDQ